MTKYTELIKCLPHVFQRPDNSDQTWENEEKKEDEMTAFRLSAPVSPSKVSLRPERGFDRVITPPNLNLDITPPPSSEVSKGWSIDFDEDTRDSCESGRCTSPPPYETEIDDSPPPSPTQVFPDGCDPSDYFFPYEGDEIFLDSIGHLKEERETEIEHRSR